MPEFFNPDGMAPPQAAYSHGVKVKAGADLLFIAGQLGVKPNGALGEGIEEQAVWAFRNLINVVKAAGMEATDLVKVQILIRDEGWLPIVEAVNNAAFGEARPASTLLVVKSLAMPQFLIEVEGVAAKDG